MHITCLVFKWQVTYIPIFFPMFVLSFLHGTPLLIHRSTYHFHRSLSLGCHTYHFHRSLIGLSLAHVTLPFYKSTNFTTWSSCVPSLYQFFLLCGGRCGCDEFSQLWASRPIWNYPKKSLALEIPRISTFLFLAIVVLKPPCLWALVWLANPSCIPIYECSHNKLNEIG
jgi:hypothetical protein